MLWVRNFSLWTSGIDRKVGMLSERLSGVELAAQMEREWLVIRILLISGHAGEQSGQTRYTILEKPFTMQDFLLKLAEVLGSRVKP
jgi:hypothetical protein